MNPLAMDRLRNLYLDLLKKTLMDIVRPEDSQYILLRTMTTDGYKMALLKSFDAAINRKGFCIVRNLPAPDERMAGRNVWPKYAETMIGMARLDNLQYCVEQVIASGVPGDLIETGAWRGGATILMRAILMAYGITDRTVWVADSFEGLPAPDVERYPADASSRFHVFDELRISLEAVQANFEKYNLLDQQVRFLKGWFKDTLPSAPVQQLAVLRLDGDMYESTQLALVHLYPKLSPGGFIIIDDYGQFEGCRQAVMEYRAEQGIREEIQEVDWTSVYWQKKG